MSKVFFCPVKINLTLRVLEKRENGYHELRSVFWKKTGTEVLCVSEAADGRQSLNVDGAKIEGRNLLDSVLEFALHKISVPPLAMKLRKCYPQGSGIGAGSGNAAALLMWLKDEYGLNFTAEEAAELGADVAVLAQDNVLSFAEGIGEKLTPVNMEIKLPWLIVFPKWSSSTAAAYRSLDDSRRGFKMRDFSSEADEIITRLASGRRAGLLPNDFLCAAMAEHPEYTDIFKSADRNGALAWGMCGSGSAAFVIADGNILDITEEELRSKEFVYATERLD